MTTSRSDAERIDATFGTPEAARRAIQALENHGVDGNRIELEGPAAEAARNPDAPTQGADEAVSERAWRSTGGGAILGTLLGGLIGLAAGLVSTGGDFTGVVIGLVLGGAGAGAGVGFAVGGIGRMKQAEAWEETFDAPGGASVTVVVHPSDHKQRERALEILRDQGAEDVHEAGDPTV